MSTEASGSARIRSMQSPTSTLSSFSTGIGGRSVIHRVAVKKLQLIQLFARSIHKMESEPDRVTPDLEAAGAAHEGVVDRRAARQAELPVGEVAVGELHHQPRALAKLAHEVLGLALVDDEFESGIAIVEVHARAGGTPHGIGVEDHAESHLLAVRQLPAAGAELDGDG